MSTMNAHGTYDSRRVVLSEDGLGSELEKLDAELRENGEIFQPGLANKLYNLQAASLAVTNYRQKLAKAQSKMQGIKEALRNAANQRDTDDSLANIISTQDLRSNMKGILGQLELISSLPTQIERATQHFLSASSKQDYNDFDIVNPFEKWMKLFFFQKKMVYDFANGSLNLTGSQKLDESIAALESSEHMVWGEIFTSISRFIDVARTQPKKLLQCTIIIETFEKQLKIQKVELALLNHSTPETGFGIDINSKRRKCMRILQAELQNFVEKVFPDQGLSIPENEDTTENELFERSKQRLEVLITSGTKALKEFEALVNLAHKIIPEIYCFPMMLRKAFEPKLLHSLQQFLDEKQRTSFSGEQILELVSFLGQYMTSLVTTHENSEVKENRLDLPAEKTSNKNVDQLLRIHEGDFKAMLFDVQVDDIYVNNLRKFCAQLMQRYITQAAMRLDSFISNLLVLDEDTALAEKEAPKCVDFFNLVSEEIKVVSGKKLHPDLLHEFVAKICFDSAKIYCAKSKEKLLTHPVFVQKVSSPPPKRTSSRFSMSRSSARSKKVTFNEEDRNLLLRRLMLISAFINNFDTAYNICDTTLRAEIGVLLHDTSSPLMQQFENEVLVEFSESVGYGARSMTQMMISVFADTNCFECLFGSSLKRHESALKVMLTATEEGFEAIHLRSDNLLGKCVGEFFRELVSMYGKKFVLSVAKLKLEKTDVLHFQVKKDLAMCQRTFMQFLDVLKYGKIFGKEGFEAVLRPVECLSRFLHNSTSKEDAELYEEFKTATITLCKVLCVNDEARERVLWIFISVAVKQNLLPKDLGESLVSLASELEMSSSRPFLVFDEKEMRTLGL